MIDVRSDGSLVVVHLTQVQFLDSASHHLTKSDILNSNLISVI